MHVTKMSDLYDLKPGTTFFILDGEWRGRIVRRDNRKYLEIHNGKAYDLHPLADSDAPLDLRIVDIRVEGPRAYTATVHLNTDEGVVRMYFYVEVPGDIPTEDEQAVAKAEAEKFMRSVIKDKTYTIEVTACPRGDWGKLAVNGEHEEKRK